MDHQYRYWKRKRHVFHFIMLMVCITALNIIFWIDVLDYMKHMDENGVIDPAYESPTTVAVVITFLIFVLALIFFIVDLIYYFNVKKRIKRNTTNNVEIKVKSDDPKVNSALDDAQAKFMTAGIVADLNKQTEIDAEYSYKLERVVNNKETFCLFFYTLYKPFGITILAAILMCVGLNMLFNINNPQEAIIPSIISASAAILFLLLIFVILVVNANANKKKALETTKEMGIRIYSDHIEQYNIVTKGDSEAEIRYKVPFLKMKHLETKKAIYCRGYNNGQVVALRLDKKEMPEEAYILIKAKLKK